MEILLAILGLAVLLIVGASRSKANSSDESEPARAFRSETQPRGRASAAPNAVWIQPGHEVSIAGHTIRGGLFYMGTSLPSVSGYGDEPALVNPNLRVDELGGGRGSDPGYVRAYSDLSPTARAAFLKWHAQGRPTEDTPDWMAELFAYGIERRIVVDGQGAVSRDELIAIRAEVARLCTGAREWRLGPLLDLLEVMTLESPLYQHPAPLRRNGFETPLVTRVALGQLAADGRPLSPDWAYSWLYGSQEYNPRTPATRCAEEFRALFRIRYTEMFGDGLNLRPTQAKLQAEYRPISPSFVGSAKLTLPNVPDISRLQSPLRKFADVAETCCNELDAYSRWIGRKREGDSLPALSLLPKELLMGLGSANVASLETSLERVIGRDLHGTMAGTALLLLWPTDASDKFTKSEAVQFAQLLEKLGFGIEPDVRFGGSAITAKTTAVVFRLPATAPVAPSAEYSGAVLLMRLASAVATADGTSEAEREFLQAHLESAINMSSAEKIRLKAHVHWLLNAHPGLTGLKKQLEGLSAEQRLRIGAFLVGAAGADGFVSPKEVKVLTRLFQLLGLGEEDVFRQVHALAAEPTAVAADPVTIIKAESASSFTIPPATSPDLGGRVTLDMRRVEATLAETAEVSKLLGTIFVDEEPPQRAARAPSAPSIGEAPGGLGEDHAKLLSALTGRPVWKRAEIEQITSELGLMVDGALEAINEAAFSLRGEPVIEGDDPMEVNVGLAREMMA